MRLSGATTKLIDIDVCVANVDEDEDADADAKVNVDVGQRNLKSSLSSHPPPSTPCKGAQQGIRLPHKFGIMLRLDAIAK